MGTQQETILHNLISVFKGTQVFTKRWMSRNVTSKCDPRLNIIFFQKVHQLEAIHTLKRDCEPVWLDRIVWECIIWTSLKVLKVSLHHLTSRREEPLQLIQLNETKGGIHLTRLEVIPGDAIEELPVVGDTIHGVVEAFTWLLNIITDTPPIPKHESSLKVLIVIEHDHTTNATRCDDVARIEARS